MHRDLDDLHQRSHEVEWRTLAADRARSSTTALLDELAAMGFAWRDVARLVGVSVPAVQKWRRGEGATGENRARLASLLAACDLIAAHYLVEDLATEDCVAWLQADLGDGLMRQHMLEDQQNRSGIRRAARGETVKRYHRRPPRRDQQLDPRVTGRAALPARPAQQKGGGTAHRRPPAGRPRPGRPVAGAGLLRRGRQRLQAAAQPRLPQRLSSAPALDSVRTSATMWCE